MLKVIACAIAAIVAVGGCVFLIDVATSFMAEWERLERVRRFGDDDRND